MYSDELSLKMDSDMLYVCESLQLAKILVAAGSDFLGTADCDITPLMNASLTGQTGIVELLLREILLVDRSRINHVMYDGSTALTFAVGNKHEEIVKMLIEACAKLSYRQPLHAAASFDSVELARAAFEENPTHIREKDSRGLTPLMIAIQKGSLNVARFIIELDKTTVRDRSTLGETILMMTIQSSPTEFIKRVLSMINDKANLNAVDFYGISAYFIAKRKGLYEIADLIKEATRK